LLDLQRIPGDLLEPLRDGIAVDWTKRRDLQDQKIERALEEIGFRWGHANT
jgi:hypothetical protein